MLLPKGIPPCCIMLKVVILEHVKSINSVYRVEWTKQRGLRQLHFELSFPIVHSTTFSNWAAASSLLPCCKIAVCFCYIVHFPGWIHYKVPYEMNRQSKLVTDCGLSFLPFTTKTVSNSECCHCICICVTPLMLGSKWWLSVVRHCRYINKIPGTAEFIHIEKG